MLDQKLALKIAGDIAVSYAAFNLSDEKVTRWAAELRLLNEGDARRVVDRVTARLDSPPSRAQLRQVIDEVHAKTMSPAFDTSLCVFMDGVACRNCGEIHGHRMSSGQLLHGVYHLRGLLAGDEEHREAAMRPESCECGFTPPEGVALDRALEETTRSMFA